MHGGRVRRRPEPGQREPGAVHLGQHRRHRGIPERAVGLAQPVQHAQPRSRETGGPGQRPETGRERDAEPVGQGGEPAERGRARCQDPGGLQGPGDAGQRGQQVRAGRAAPGRVREQVARPGRPAGGRPGGRRRAGGRRCRGRGRAGPGWPVPGPAPGPAGPTRIGAAPGAIVMSSHRAPGAGSGCRSKVRTRCGRSPARSSRPRWQWFPWLSVTARWWPRSWTGDGRGLPGRGRSVERVGAGEAGRPRSGWPGPAPAPRSVPRALPRLPSGPSGTATPTGTARTGPAGGTGAAPPGDQPGPGPAACSAPILARAASAPVSCSSTECAMDSPIASAVTSALATWSHLVHPAHGLLPVVPWAARPPTHA